MSLEPVAGSAQLSKRMRTLTFIITLIACILQTSFSADFPEIKIKIDKNIVDPNLNYTSPHIQESEHEYVLKLYGIIFNGKKLTDLLKHDDPCIKNMAEILMKYNESISKRNYQDVLLLYDDDSKSKIESFLQDEKTRLRWEQSLESGLSNIDKIYLVWERKGKVKYIYKNIVSTPFVGEFDCVKNKLVAGKDEEHEAGVTSLLLSYLANKDSFDTIHSQKEIKKFNDKDFFKIAAVLSLLTWIAIYLIWKKRRSKDHSNF